MLCQRNLPITIFDYITYHLLPLNKTIIYNGPLLIAFQSTLDEIGAQLKSADSHFQPCYD